MFRYTGLYECVDIFHIILKLIRNNMMHEETGNLGNILSQRKNFKKHLKKLAFNWKVWVPSWPLRWFVPLLWPHFRPRLLCSVALELGHISLIPSPEASLVLGGTGGKCEGGKTESRASLLSLPPVGR